MPVSPGNLKLSRTTFAANFILARLGGRERRSALPGRHSVPICGKRIIAVTMFAGLGSSGLRRVTLLLVLLSCVALAFVDARAQTDPQKERPRRVMPADPEPQDVIRIDTDLVPVDVVVTDARGRLVRNLKKEDFKLFEDGSE